MILNEIKEKLHEVDQNVFYGMVDPKMRETLWNYTVFNREKMTPSANRTGYSYYFSVHVVREDFIPDGLEKTVIDKVLEIDGMRLAAGDGTYDYVQKPSTNAIVEMFSVSFVKAVKV